MALTEKQKRKSAADWEAFGKRCEKGDADRRKIMSNARKVYTKVKPK